jgi:hypothetical protein
MKTRMYQCVVFVFSLFYLTVPTDTLYGQPGSVQSAEESRYQQLFNTIRNTHDLSFPDWGPYTKKYIGLSHIADVQQGIRFDLSVFPGFYRRKVDVPNTFFESGYHPWEASPDLNYFSFRHELEWKDQVYADISYSRIDDQARLIRMECVNQTAEEQSMALHFMASLHFPSLKPYAPDDPLYPAKVVSPYKVNWVRAVDYVRIITSDHEPQKNLVYDGHKYKEVRDHGFVTGAGVGQGFGRHQGDQASYAFSVVEKINDAVLLFRYRMKKENSIKLVLSGVLSAELACTGTDDFSTLTVPAGAIDQGQYDLTITSHGGSPIELDGFCLVPQAQVQHISFQKIKWQPVPEISPGPVANSRIIKYADIDSYYGIMWFTDDYQVREFFCRDLDVYFRRMANEHVLTKFQGEGEGHYTNVFMRPIRLHPRSAKTLYGLACTGSREQVTLILQKQAGNLAGFEKIYREQREKLVDQSSSTDGSRFTFSMDRMAATLLTNVVFPVYTQKSYIRHSTPGRWWDCLYTWDSGFIGLGLLELDTQRAIESLNAYTTPPGDQSAFIHHGSPVPVQMSLFLELWNRTQSQELLRYFYPRLQQYYRFIAGHDGSSTTRVLKSNLTKTWDYFYNSGGWDDLPPQKYVHDHGLEATVAPIISAAHCIRSAKILKMAAQELGLPNDAAAYDADIRMFSTAIQRNAWDEQTGYFGYVVHNEKGEPVQLLRTAQGENLNKTFDGCYPLFAGICTPQQTQRIMEHLSSDGQIWSPIGLSAVDQSAGYYLKDGYWNGAVWLSHQWFFWKTMLDLGEEAFAHKIALTALEVWKNEVETSYNCMEHFIIETGRGAGWHQFGGLSAPVLSWFASYYRPGHITTGYNVWLKNYRFNDDCSALTAEWIHASDSKEGHSTILVCMNPQYHYDVQYNGKKTAVQVYDAGSLAVTINNADAKGSLRIVRR